MSRTPDLEPPDLDAEAANRRRVVWVDGRVVLEGYDENLVIACDRASQYLAKIGLQMHIRVLNSEEEPPENIRKRIDPRRIPLSDVELHACNPPGQTAEEIARQAYYITPWTPEAQEVALRKTLVALDRLRKARRLVRWYREDGVAIWGRLGWKPGLKEAAVINPQDAPNVAMLRAGRNLLNGDEELARKVYEAMFLLREPGPKPDPKKA